MDNYLAIIKFRSLIDYRHQEKLEKFIKENFSFRDLNNIDCIDIQDEFHFLVFCNYSKIMNFGNFLESNLILTDLIIINIENLVDFNDLLVKFENKNIIENFLKNNISVDSLLDKLSAFGLNSLSDFEKEFLKNSK